MAFVPTASSVDYDILMKTIVIGDSGVGKSSLLHRYMDDTWSPSYIATIGVDFKIDTFECDGKVVKLQLWDTAGHERFKAIAAAYYRGAHCILLCYDTTDRDTFLHVKDWIEEVRQYARDDVPMALVGTKADLKAKREVSKYDAQEFADSLGIRYYETSSKDASGGVQPAVRTAVAEAMQYRLETLAIEAKERRQRYHIPSEPVHPQKRSCFARFRGMLGF